MTRYTIAVLYAGGVLSIAAIGARRWNGARPVEAAPSLEIQRIRAARGDSLPALLDSAEERMVVNDPFRLANAPATVRYKPSLDGGVGGAPAYAPAPVRPVMTLKAIVGGPPWQAIIDGIPGQPAGAIARTGSVFDKLTVRAVTRDSVIVQGPDTAWILSFRKRS